MLRPHTTTTSQSVAKKAPRHIFGERDVGLAFDSDVIVVVDPAEVIELQVPRKRSGLTRDALHHAAVAAERVNPVPEQFKIWPVVSRREPLFANGHSHARRNASCQRTGERLAKWRKDLMSSSVTEGLPRIS